MKAMRQIVVLVLIVGCSSDGAGDDDQPHPPPEGHGDEDVAKDREECELADAAASCPPGWGITYHSGPSTKDDALEFVDLRDVGEPVCSGRGVYADSESLLGSGAIAVVPIVSNSQCFIACNPECALTSVCWAERPGGQQCGTFCAFGQGLSEDECTKFVAECLDEDAASCGP